MRYAAAVLLSALAAAAVPGRAWAFRPYKTMSEVKSKDALIGREEDGRTFRKKNTLLATAKRTRRKYDEKTLREYKLRMYTSPGQLLSPPPPAEDPTAAVATVPARAARKAQPPSHGPLPYILFTLLVGGIVFAAVYSRRFVPSIAPAAPSEEDRRRQAREVDEIMRQLRRKR